MGRVFEGHSSWQQKLFPLYWEVNYKWSKTNLRPPLSHIITNLIQSQHWELLELTKASTTHFNQLTSLQGQRAGLRLSIFTARKFSPSKCNPCCCGRDIFLFILVLVDTQQQLLITTSQLSIPVEGKTHGKFQSSHKIYNRNWTILLYIYLNVG